MLVNTSMGRDPNAEPATPASLDPWERRDRERERRPRGEEPFIPIEALKYAWVDQQGRA
jgi:hypothetical protein